MSDKSGTKNKSLTVEIDLNDLLGSVMNMKRYYDGCNTVEYILKDSFREEVKYSIVKGIYRDIKDNLELDKFVSIHYSKSFLRKEAEKILQESLLDCTREWIRCWVDDNIKDILEEEIARKIKDIK